MKKNQSLLFFVLDPDNVKRLGPQNLEQVEKLTLKNTEYLFGYQSAEVQLDRSYLALGVYNEEEDLCGVVCLSPYPNIPALPAWEWSHWLHNLYKLDFDQMSTLWIHYSVWDRKYTTMFLKVIMQNLFQSHEIIEQVVYICPPGISRLDFIEDIATRVTPAGHANHLRVQGIYILKREDFVAHYTIRKAVEEDNDDLIAIIPKELEEKYGHYYISELLSDSDQEDRQIIVAEYQGCAVGVLCLNEAVNYDILNEEFEMVPYNGLKKPSPDDEVCLFHVPSFPNIMAEDSERLPSILLKEDKTDEESVTDEQTSKSEDEFSLLTVASSLILNYIYQDDVGGTKSDGGGSLTSIESHFSAVVLNEDYQDHLYISHETESFAAEDRRYFGRPGRAAQESVGIPTFYGEPNAFVIEICSALEEHENSLYLLFQAAFQCFPDRDYAVVSFPPSSTNLYLMKHFARVIKRASSVFQHELYVLHKNAILDKLTVRVAVSSDVDQVRDLIKGMIKPGAIEEHFRETVDNSAIPRKGYVFLCGEQIIGCAEVSEEEEHEYLEMNFNIETWGNIRDTRLGNRGCIDEFIVSPIFQRHVKFFLAELHRLSDFRVFFYRLRRYDYTYTHRTLPIINSLCTMVPVLPNAAPEYDTKIIQEYKLPDCLFMDQTPFALYLSTPRLLGIPRLDINYRLVVIGAGVTTLAFLETIIFSKNPKALVTFNNITVVSPHGIMYHKQPSPVRDMIFVSNGHTSRRYMESLCLRTYTHVVTGVMVAINRKEKYVILTDDTFIPYDYLLLLVGEQFQKPQDKKKDPMTEKKKTEYPANVFIINTEADAGNAFNALKNMVTSEKKGNIVVYGHYLEACCCLAGLMKYGVAGSNLIYVDPTPQNGPCMDRHDHLTQFFNNGEVETAVFDEMLAQGITIYQDYDFVEWYLDNSTNLVYSIKFESKYKFVELELMAFFIYHGKEISTKSFQAIVKSGLVFNGRLVIDQNYQTNDPFIYAAGSSTMYSKKYHAEHLMHKYYNGEDVGVQLGKAIRRKLIPTEYCDIQDRPTLRRKPIVQYCQFPGDLQYLHVSQPGKPVPLDVAINKSTYGKILVTGSCKRLDKQGYFRLHLNQYNTIETITCLAKFPIHVQNLICLYGKHESIFNNLLLRYQMQMIPDLFEFFNEPWTCAIYHKRFSWLMDQIEREFIVRKTIDGQQLVEEVRKMLISNDWTPLNKIQNDEIEEMCRDCGLVKTIEQKVLYFLHNNYQFLPMYLHKMFIRWILHQIKTSPLFSKSAFIVDTDTTKISELSKMSFFRKIH